MEKHDVIRTTDKSGGGGGGTIGEIVVWPLPTIPINFLKWDG